jgi:hypothetical protein
MKIIIAFACSFLFLASAHAATLELRPAGPVSGADRWQCAATGFAPNTIVGACMERHYGVCSGRGCVPKISVLGIWSTIWDLTGAPTVDFNTSVNWPGCQGTQSVIVVNGVPMYYISADANGNQLAENNCISWLVAP